MTDAELIARQAKYIAEQADLLDEYRSVIRRIHGVLFNCSGPLNGNLNGYNKEQFREWLRVKEAVDFVIDDVLEKEE